MLYLVWMLKPETRLTKRPKNSLPPDAKGYWKIGLHTHILKEVSADLATVEQLKGWKQVSSHPPHKSSAPGVLCVDIHPVKQDLTLTGGVDKTAVVFNRNTGKKEVFDFLVISPHSFRPLWLATPRKFLQLCFTQLMMSL